MHDDVTDYYMKMLRVSKIPPLLEETYTRAKMLSDRLDGGMFNGRELAIIALVAGCDPFGKGGVDPPRDLDHIGSAVPSEDNGLDAWEKGADLEVDWNGKKEATFVEMVGNKIRVKFKKDESVRDMRPSRVRMLEGV